MKRLVTSRIVVFTILAISLCLPHFTSAYFQEDLNLTDEQIADLKELKAETRKAIKPLVEELRELRVHMQETILAEDIDTDKVAKQIEKITEIKSQIVEVVNNSNLEAAKILTPEQRELLLEKKEERRERINEFRAKWREVRKYIKDFLNSIENIIS